MMLVHIAVRPYVSDVLNLFDGCMLVTIMLVISLLIIETYRGLQTTATLITTIILITMPLFTFLVMAVYLHAASIKKLGISSLRYSRNQEK